jgi:predicted Zn-dependent protease
MMLQAIHPSRPTPSSPVARAAWTEPRRLLAVVAASGLLLAASPVEAPTIGNRDLFRKSAEAAAEALTQYGQYDHPEEQQRLNDIGYRLARHSGYDKFPFSFYLVDMPIPNAFALPGGHIFVTRGMLDLDLSDDMLAALLGHEIAHVTEQHFLRMKKRATLLNVLSQLLTVGVLVGASRSDDDTPASTSPWDPRNYGRQDRTADLVQGAAAAGLVFTELLLRSYSRENEDESDEEGQRIAAAAGFDPDGERQLMARMRSRIPQSESYGYWRTHPFFEDRVRAAEAREKYLKIQEPKPSAAYRQSTQAVLLEFKDRQHELTPHLEELLKETALAAWPQGPAADELRLEKLHVLRDQELAKRPMAQDYGRILAAYQKQIASVTALSPESPLLASLREEIGEMRRQVADRLPQAVEILDSGVYETPFLEIFLSNFPDADQVPRVALQLGIAYSRLGRETDAVESFLKAWNQTRDLEAGEQAGVGLRNLAPSLSQLGALQHLASQDEDPELQRLSLERLEELASSYDDLANGADYLARFPDGEYVDTVNQRLNKLAENLYREMVLYQNLGDAAKALERINQILTHAPLSPAAERLGEQAVLES